MYYGFTLNEHRAENQNTMGTMLQAVFVYYGFTINEHRWGTYVYAGLE